MKAWQPHDIRFCKTETKWLFTWFKIVISPYAWFYVTYRHWEISTSWPGNTDNCQNIHCSFDSICDHINKQSPRLVLSLFDNVYCLNQWTPVDNWWPKFATSRKFQQHWLTSRLVHSSHPENSRPIIWPPCNHHIYNHLSNISLMYCRTYVNSYDAVGSVIPCDKLHKHPFSFNSDGEQSSMLRSAGNGTIPIQG